MLPSCLYLPLLHSILLFSAISSSRVVHAVDKTYRLKETDPDLGATYDISTGFKNYIVKLPPATDRAQVLDQLQQEGFNITSQLGYQYDYIFNGFSASMPNFTIEALEAMVPGVIIVEEGIIQMFEPSSLVTTNSKRDDDSSPTGQNTVQQHATWGQARISKPNVLRNGDDTGPAVWYEDDFIYYYNHSNGGPGNEVDVYVLDSGVNIQHEQFEGRARFGWASKKLVEKEGIDDTNGHGTHCAGLAASKAFGIANKARIIAVKVGGSDGKAQYSDLYGGIEYTIHQHHVKSSEPNFSGSIISLSMGIDKTLEELGGGLRQGFDLLDATLESASESGIHIVVAAGNSNIDACDVYFAKVSEDTQPSDDIHPAYNKSIVSVGAIDITDTRASFSNYGACVDIYAPGVDIMSTWIGSNTATQRLQGTSMAAPLISGLIAYWINLYPEYKLDPLGMKNKLISSAVAKVNDPTGKAGNGLIPWNGFQGIADGCGIGPFGGC